jgi:hypothetical protein
MELDDSNPRYSRFTFPNKFTRSLAAGLPVISIGHPECTLTKFANNYQLGPVITDTNPEEIALKLLPALSQVTDWPKLRDEILRCAEKEFNGAVNREKLHGLFRAGAQK